MDHKYNIDVILCEESGVLVGTSEDIPGLTLEADTLGNLFDAAMDVVPQLLERNLGVPTDAEVQVTMRCHQPATVVTEQRSGRTRKPPVNLPRPRFVFEEDLDPAYA